MSYQHSAIHEALSPALCLSTSLENPETLIVTEKGRASIDEV